MMALRDFRCGKPGSYPDQAVYAEFACSHFGLSFHDRDGGTGLLFSVSSQHKQLYFGAGRCSYYPQNNATASTLASDKYFTNNILEREGIATLGGEYFFLHERNSARRPPGHERDSAFLCLKQLGGSAFAKPLSGSRGDFAQTIESEDALRAYLDEVSVYYDSILLQPICSGIEYRIFLLDGEVAYTARKYPPYLLGDGVHSIRELLAAHNEALRSLGLSPVAVQGGREAALDTVLLGGERWELGGRMNLSAGGRTLLEAPRNAAAIEVARNAARALGLRVAAVDLFTEADGEPGAVRVIEVNSNPSIRLLEETNRDDLILKIWRHAFSAMGLLQ